MKTLTQEQIQDLSEYELKDLISELKAEEEKRKSTFDERVKKYKDAFAHDSEVFTSFLEKNGFTKEDILKEEHCDTGRNYDRNPFALELTFSNVFDLTNKICLRIQYSKSDFSRSEKLTLYFSFYEKEDNNSKIEILKYAELCELGNLTEEILLEAIRQIHLFVMRFEHQISSARDITSHLSDF